MNELGTNFTDNIVHYKKSGNFPFFLFICASIRNLYK